MIRANAHKYSISALCQCLGIARSAYYYECRGREDESALEEAVQSVYDENRRVYGQRKLKRALFRKGWNVSRRKIGQIMKKRGLVSAYIRKKYRVHASKSNEAAVPNLLDRDFNFSNKNMYNKLANYVYLHDQVNNKVSDFAPEAYMTEVRKFNGAFGNEMHNSDELSTNLKDNAIPAVIEGGNAKNYMDFLKERQRLMALKVKEFYFKL